MAKTRQEGELTCLVYLVESRRYPKAMEVKLTVDQKAFVRETIESGRLKREEDAVREALALWEERERTRAETLAAVDEARLPLAVARGASSRSNPCATLRRK